MGYKYSIWLIPNNWKDIMKFYNTKHIPHVTIKTLLSKNEAFFEVNKYKKKYLINFENNIYNFDKISYHNDTDKDFPACGIFCKITNLKLEHIPHMTLYYHFNKSVILTKEPKSCIANVCIVNTNSDNPEKWTII